MKDFNPNERYSLVLTEKPAEGSKVIKIFSVKDDQGRIFYPIFSNSSSFSLKPEWLAKPIWYETTFAHIVELLPGKSIVLNPGDPDQYAFNTANLKKSPTNA